MIDSSVFLSLSSDVMYGVILGIVLSLVLYWIRK